MGHTDAEYNSYVAEESVSARDDPYAFDPGDYTVDEVLWFLRQNPSHRSRVITMEAIGRKRKGIVGANPVLAIKMANAATTPGGKAKCQEVHPIYATQCERQDNHAGPCAHVIYWNEEGD